MAGNPICRTSDGSTGARGAAGARPREGPGYDASASKMSGQRRAARPSQGVASRCKLRRAMERSNSAATLAGALAAGAVVLLIVFVVANVESAAWLLVGLLGLAAAGVAFGMTGGRPRGATLAAGVVGAVLALLVIVWAFLD